MIQYTILVLSSYQTFLLLGICARNGQRPIKKSTGTFFANFANLKNNQAQSFENIMFI